MREIHINISVPDDSDIDSAVINLKHKVEAKECENKLRRNKHTISVPVKTGVSEEPDEGLLYDELY